MRQALAALIDYAGLYPPAELSLAQAQEEFRAARAGSHAWLLGRFILPASVLTEADAALEGPFSAIADGTPVALRALAASPLAGAVEALEIRLDAAAADVEDAIATLRAAIDDAALGQLPAFVEIPRGDDWPATLTGAFGALRRTRLGAKLRCGGATAAAFPSVDEVAAFLSAAQAQRVPFKATAGLHHPVRHRDRATGSMMHGFLNLLAAAALAPRVDDATLARVVAEEDAAAFAFGDHSFSWRGHRVNVGGLARMRTEAFVAYGSCSFAEPVEDLIALGILPA